MLKIIGLIATVAAGFGLGRATFTVRVRKAILTALLAAVAQASLQFALPHGMIEQIAQSQLYTAPGQIVLIALAVLETIGPLRPGLPHGRPPGSRRLRWPRGRPPTRASRLSN